MSGAACNTISDTAKKAIKQFWTYGNNDDLFKTLQELAAYARDAVGPGLQFLYDKPNVSGSFYTSMPVVMLFYGRNRRFSQLNPSSIHLVITCMSQQKASILMGMMRAV